MRLFRFCRRTKQKFKLWQHWWKSCFSSRLWRRRFLHSLNGKLLLLDFHLIVSYYFRLKSEKNIKISVFRNVFFSYFLFYSNFFHLCVCFLYTFTFMAHIQMEKYKRRTMTLFVWRKKISNISISMQNNWYFRAKS